MVRSQKTCAPLIVAPTTVARNWRAVYSTSGNSGNDIPLYSSTSFPSSTCSQEIFSSFASMSSLIGYLRFGLNYTLLSPRQAIDECQCLDHGSPFRCSKRYSKLYRLCIKLLRSLLREPFRALCGPIEPELPGNTPHFVAMKQQALLKIKPAEGKSAWQRISVRLSWVFSQTG